MNNYTTAVFKSPEKDKRKTWQTINLVFYRLSTLRIILHIKKFEKIPSWASLITAMSKIAKELKQMNL